MTRYRFSYKTAPNAPIRWVVKNTRREAAAARRARIAAGAVVSPVEPTATVRASFR